jgi:hypothetical protein
MKTTNPLDAVRIELLLSELRPPAIKLIWAKLAEQSDKEGWPAARFLAPLAEHEIAERTLHVLCARSRLVSGQGTRMREWRIPTASY